jgi:hypothetical protein
MIRRLTDEEVSTRRALSQSKKRESLIAMYRDDGKYEGRVFLMGSGGCAWKLYSLRQGGILVDQGHVELMRNSANEASVEMTQAEAEKQLTERMEEG